MERELTFRIVLERPPAGVDFGLQKGRGSIYEVMQKQRSANGDLSFVFTAGVKDSSKDAPPNVIGSFTQGPPESDSSISTSAVAPVRQIPPGAGA